MYQDNKTEISIPDKGEALAQWYRRRIDIRLAVALPFKKETMMRNALLSMAVVHKRIISGTIYTLKSSKGKLDATTFTGACK